MNKRIALISLGSLLSFSIYAQSCNCDLISGDLTLGTGAGAGSLITHFSDNGTFRFHYPKWRGGWKWTTASSNGEKTAMQLQAKYDGGDIELRLGNGSGPINFITPVGDNNTLNFHIPHWRGGWKWSTSSSTGSKTAMQLFTKYDGGNVELRLDGKLISSEVKVMTNVWSDFVFETDYELRTLEEVEQHINDKGHLPEIPSEAEVTENGINLGEMNAKLLQKIEELTLYMIDVNKRVKTQAAEIENLKSENSELKEKVNSLENK